MANKHLIDCRGDAPQLILQLSLYRQIIFIWSFSHLNKVSVSHTNISTSLFSLLIFKHVASFCLWEKVLLHKICHLNLIKRNISNIKQHSISHHKWDGVETEKMTGICQECAGLDAIRIKFGKTTLLREGTKNPFDYPIWMSIGTTESLPFGFGWCGFIRICAYAFRIYAEALIYSKSA